MDSQPRTTGQAADASLDRTGVTDDLALMDRIAPLRAMLLEYNHVAGHVRAVLRAYNYSPPFVFPRIIDGRWTILITGPVLSPELQSAIAQEISGVAPRFETRFTGEPGVVHS